jgi:hypothetical protein
VANSNQPMGLRPVATLGQNGYVGKIEAFSVPATDATAIGIGDPVTLTGAGGLSAAGLPICKRGTVGGVAAGVMVGTVINPLDLTMTGGYRKASTAMTILVDTDPNTIYEIQEDSVGGSISLANGTKNVSLILGTVDTVTGNSKTMADSSTVAADATLDLLLLRPAPAVDNTPAATNAKWLVKLNLHQYATGVVRVGV